MSHKIFLFIFFGIVISRSLTAQEYCIPHRFSDGYYFESKDIRVEKDIVYGRAEDYKGNLTDLKLDLYYPDPSIDSLKERPLVILFHGGGFAREDKSQMEKYCPLFAERGFVAATVNYRLGYAGVMGDSASILAAYRAFQDAYTAINFLVNHAASYNIDPEAIFIGGQSTGGVLSMAISHANRNYFEIVYPWAVAGLGKTDPFIIENGPLLRIRGCINLWGGWSFGPYISVSRIHRIPLIMFYGTADSSYDLGKGIVEKFRQSGGCYQFYSRTGAGHGEDMSKYYIVERAGCFIKRILCDSCITLEGEMDNRNPECNNPLNMDIPPVERAAVTLDSSSLSRLTGTYSFTDEGEKKEYRISAGNGRLYLDPGHNREKWELFAESPLGFFMKDENAQFTFDLENGTIRGFTFYIDAKKIHAGKN